MTTIAFGGSSRAGRPSVTVARNGAGTIRSGRSKVLCVHGIRRQDAAGGDPVEVGGDVRGTAQVEVDERDHRRAVRGASGGNVDGGQVDPAFPIAGCGDRRDQRGRTWKGW